MAKWTFEPGHTAAEFSVRHMMVCWVRGHFKNITGTIEFDPENPSRSSVDTSIHTAELWSGDPDRDGHLRAADFLDVENHSTITFKGNEVELSGKNDFRVTGDLTIRGVTRKASLEVNYLGQWGTPFWVDGKDQGPRMRAGFVARTRIDRTDFGIDWNGELENGGVVVGKEVLITIDVEALLARTMHKFSTAATKSSALTALHSVGLLNVPYSTFAGASFARLVRSALSSPRNKNLCIIRARAVMETAGRSFH